MLGFQMPVWGWAIMAIVFLIPFAQMRLKRRSNRNRHIQSHPPMSDADFLAALALPDPDADTCLRLRKATAKALSVPIETLYPADAMLDLMQLGLDNAGWVEFMLAIEWEFEVGIDGEVFAQLLAPGLDSLEGVTFGDYVTCCVQHWDEIVTTD